MTPQELRAATNTGDNQMNIDNLTIAEAREIARLFGAVTQAAPAPHPSGEPGAAPIRLKPISSGPVEISVCGALAA